ncbi:abortive infection family protein [Haliea sp. AH-315-K21]|uniref:Abortive infection protein-like C-terminal domain-containing protein n=1 Tax=SAR86 cluster bacterium TaxID=2030880 RepID=A0A2A5CG92_9GAMM|nr:abortive infection family protein [Haliea sp. AH-315-K21]MBN4075649.1 abortive infection family protein [Gammaproteobacteria bacterium AH-315-E17]PCJ42887.1 MAG: hypothetical protein COA71_05170 [SAR86 cluster bacterium]
MSQQEFVLQNTSNALVLSEDAAHLIEQKARLEKAIFNEDAPLTLDASKSLLESIFKTVLKDRVQDPDITQDFRPLYRNVRDELPFNGNAEANSLLGNLGSAIVHNVSELRNKFGAASHGDDGYHESPIEMNDAELIAYVVDGLAGFVYRKHKHLVNPETDGRIYLSDYPEFNSYLDEQYSGFKIELGESSGIDVPASEAIFSVDRTAYKEMLVQFRATEESDAEIEQNEGIEESAEAAQLEVQLVPVAQFQQPPESEPVSIINPIQDIAASLVINEEVRLSITDDECNQLAEFVRDYALNYAGLDWQSRESLIAKFRIELKRRLIGVTYLEHYIDEAIDLLIEKAKAYYPSINE